MKDTLTKSEIKWWMALIMAVASAVGTFALSYGVYTATISTKLDRIAEDIKEIKVNQKETTAENKNLWLTLESRVGGAIKDLAIIKALHGLK